MDLNGKVIVALELSDPARDLVIARTGRRLAGPGAEVVLVHAHPVAQTAVLDFVKIESPEHLTREVDAETKKLEALAAQIEPPVTIDVAIGYPPDSLLSYSKTASLLVIGRTHKGVVGRMLEGSVETRLAHEASCPVVIVP